MNAYRKLTKWYVFKPLKDFSSSWLQYEFQSEIGFYPNTTIPDPRLEGFGVKFHSNGTLAEEEVKKRFA